jgi:hypothetical protein
MELTSGTVKNQAADLLTRMVGESAAVDDLADVAMRAWEHTGEPVARVVEVVLWEPCLGVRARELRTGDVVSQPWHRTVTAPSSSASDGRLVLTLDHEPVEVDSGKMVTRFVRYGEVIGRLRGR